MLDDRPLTKEIQEFWDQSPCGTTHVDHVPGSKEYFSAFDAYYDQYYPYLRRFLRLEKLAGKRVLELGLGSGFTLQKISQHAALTVGADLSGETVRLNQKRQQHFGSSFRLVNTSAVQLPLQQDSFDAVVTIGCLHHIPDIRGAIAEIHRVLKPGGVLYGMVYNRNSYRYRVFIPLVRRFGRQNRDKTTQQCVNEFYDGVGNPYGTVYSMSEMRHLLAGFTRPDFRIENFVGRELLPYVGDRIPRNFWLATFGKLAGLDLYFRATAVK